MGRFINVFGLSVNDVVTALCANFDSVARSFVVDPTLSSLLGDALDVEQFVEEFGAASEEWSNENVFVVSFGRGFCRQSAEFSSEEQAREFETDRAEAGEEPLFFIERRPLSWGWTTGAKVVGKSVLLVTPTSGTEIKLTPRNGRLDVAVDFHRDSTSMHWILSALWGVPAEKGEDYVTGLCPNWAAAAA